MPSLPPRSTPKPTTPGRLSGRSPGRSSAHGRSPTVPRMPWAHKRGAAIGPMRASTEPADQQDHDTDRRAGLMSPASPLRRPCTVAAAHPCCVALPRRRTMGRRFAMLGRRSMSGADCRGLSSRPLVPAGRRDHDRRPVRGAGADRCRRGRADRGRAPADASPQLNERVNRLAHALAGEGIRRGDRVGILARNCAAWVELELAAAKLGAIVAAQNWRLAPPELVHCIRLAEPRAMLVAEAYAEMLAGLDVDGAAHDHARRRLRDAPGARRRERAAGRRRARGRPR